MSRHAIGSLEFEISVSRGANVPALQDRVGALAERRVRDLLAAVLERHAPREDVLRIDRLEVDLGRLELEDLEDDLLERLDREFRAAIQETTGILGHDPPGSRTLSQNERLLSGFVHFLRTGALPWHAAAWDLRDMDSLILELSRRDRRQVTRWLREPVREGLVRRRLLYNLRSETLRALIAALSGVEESRLGALAEWVVALGPLWRRLGASAEPHDLVYEPLLRAMSNLRVIDDRARSLALVWLEASCDTRAIGSEAGQGSALREARSAARSGTPATESVPFQEALIEFLERPVEAPPSASRRPVPADDVAAPESPADEPAWFARNGGLILLWPYLTAYFERIGLVNERRFVSDEARHRALHELQFLALGPREYAEYDLVLNKALCGIPLEAPVRPRADPQPSNAAEAERLLRRAIDNWPSVGKLSVEGLRGSFLLREARLASSDDAWTLHVERKGFDVLLDRLTYSVAVVKLPWMERVMYVTW